MCVCFYVGVSAQGEARTKRYYLGVDEMKLGGGSINVKAATRTEDVKSTRSTPGQSTHPHKSTSITVQPHHIPPEGQVRSLPA